MNAMQKLMDFLTRLDDAALAYTMDFNGDDAVTVTVITDGERWEAEFFADGDVQVEVFYSDPDIGIEGEESLERLFEASDDDDEFEEDLEEEELDEDDFDEDEDEEFDVEEYDEKH